MNSSPSAGARGVEEVGFGHRPPCSQKGLCFCPCFSEGGLEA